MRRSMLYEAYEAQRDLTASTVALADLSKRWLDGLPRPWASSPLVRQTAAAFEMVARAHLTHERPPFRIDGVDVAGNTRPVREELVASTPFASLLRFSTDNAGTHQPRVLLVTALAGHFSTLLRGTVQTLVADHEVLVIDWHNARDVPLDEGRFGLDDYVAHVMEFLEVSGPGTHVIAVCQPCPATLAAVSLMASAANPAQPRSLTLMAGPVDTRINPTKVNELAHSRPLSWFEHKVITTVPGRYPGRGRRVYPGFLQVAAFVGMNTPRHVSQHLTLLDHLMSSRDEQAAVIKDFYDEYFAVLDMPAEFYLETVDAVFQRDLLPRGEMTWRGHPVDPAAITNTALLTVEGANDDICGPGQTLAAHDLCTSLKPARKLHHLQPGAGHYGVFSGSRWEQQIYPVVRAFIQANDS
jgi:poly(3-hydroxybutyrate) depolymerase